MNAEGDASPQIVYLLDDVLNLIFIVVPCFCCDNSKWLAMTSSRSSAMVLVLGQHATREDAVA